MPTDERPPEKPTTQLEKVPAWAVALTEKVQHGFSEVKADISLVANDVSIAKERIGVVETRVKQLEDRSESNSLRAKGASEVDLKHEAVIADLVVKVESIETKTDAQTQVLKTLEKHATDILSNPRVKALSWALWLALAGWLASKGIKVSL